MPCGDNVRNSLNEAAQMFGWVKEIEAQVAEIERIERIRAEERERCAVTALEQRCERGTPWDLACTTIAEKIRNLK